jgi:uncharacterized protein (DUF1778 family)
MKKPKIGRPPVPKKLEKASLLSVRFTADERKDLERAAERLGMRLSEWARRTLIAAASTVDNDAS